MADWSFLKLSAKRAARTAIKETGEAADIATLHIKLKALESKRNSEYEVLGRLTYRQLKTGISQAERIAPVISNLDKIRGKIASVNTEIDEIKKARDERRARDRAAEHELEEDEKMLDEIAAEANEESLEEDEESEDN